MLIPPQRNDCIWCGRRFTIKGFKPRSEQVYRSLEHIFPDNIWGRLKAQDVCIDCNSRLGKEVDHHILNDRFVLSAGLAAGFEIHDFLKDFGVVGNAPDGDPPPPYLAELT